MPERMPEYTSYTMSDRMQNRMSKYMSEYMSGRKSLGGDHFLSKYVCPAIREITHMLVSNKKKQHLMVSRVEDWSSPAISVFLEYVAYTMILA